MSTPLVNHRPLKGKEDGIYNIAYTLKRLNPANYLQSIIFTAISLILALKNPQLVFSFSFGLSYFSYLVNLLFDRQVIKVTTTFASAKTYICLSYTNRDEVSWVESANAMLSNTKYSTRPKGYYLCRTSLFPFPRRWRSFCTDLRTQATMHIASADACGIQ